MVELLIYFSLQLHFFTDTTRTSYEMLLCGSAREGICVCVCEERERVNRCVRERGRERENG